MRALAPAGQYWTQLQELDMRGNAGPIGDWVTHDVIEGLKAAVPHWANCIQWSGMFG